MKRKPTRIALWRRTSLMVFALTLSASLAFAGPNKLSKDLQEQSGSKQVDVIVQFNHAPTAAFLQNVVSRGGTIKQNLGRFKGAVYTVSSSSLADLAADPDVAYISPDRPLYSNGNNKSAAVLDRQWNRRQLRFEQQQRGI